MNFLFLLIKINITFAHYVLEIIIQLMMALYWGCRSHKVFTVCVRPFVRLSVNIICKHQNSKSIARKQWHVACFHALHVDVNMIFDEYWPIYVGKKLAFVKNNKFWEILCKRKSPKVWVGSCWNVFYFCFRIHWN